MRVCACCGGPIEMPCSPKRIYCSERCMWTVENRKRAAKTKAAKSGKTCKWCNVAIPPERHGRTKFCSVSCYNKYVSRANKQTRNLNVKLWKQSNPDRVRVWARDGSERRRAKELNAIPTWLTRRDQFWISYYHQVAADLGLEVDHIEPLNGADRSGLHVPWNLQVLSRTRNAQKGNRR